MSIVKSFKKLFISLVAIATIGMMPSVVFATSGTGGGSPVPTLPNTTSPTPTTTTPSGNTGLTPISGPSGGNLTSPTNTNTSNSTNTNKNTSVYNNSNLPKTGVDYSILLIIVACVVFAIFAYKKIQEYNDIQY